MKLLAIIAIAIFLCAVYTEVLCTGILSSVLPNSSSVLPNSSNCPSQEITRLCQALVDEFSKCDYADKSLQELLTSELFKAFPFQCSKLSDAPLTPGNCTNGGDLCKRLENIVANCTITELDGTNFVDRFMDPDAYVKRICVSLFEEEEEK